MIDQTAFPQETIDRNTRAVDEWIARWSLAEGTLLLPLDPLTTGQTVVDLLRAGAPNPVDEPAPHR